MVRFISLCFMALSTFVIMTAYNNCAPAAKKGGGSASPPLVVSANSVDCDLSVALTSGAKLSETCFGKLVEEERSGDSFFDNFSAFIPNFPLASVLTPKKSRWIYLPPGAKLDNSDPDNWVFPVGTIIWKEFANDDVRVETRMLEKVSEGVNPLNWRAYIFYWTMDQTEAHYFTEDEFPTGPELQGQYAYDNYTTRDAAGIIESYQYKVPRQSDCLACHSGAKDVVLGFSGFQLFGGNGGWRLSTLARSELMTEEITASYAIGGSEINRRVLGLMQSNCASCHSPFNVDPNPRANAVFKLNSDATGPADTVPVQTLLANGKITPGDPDNSQLVCRLEGTCGEFMPPTIDGIPQRHFGFGALVRQWVSEMEAL